MADLITVEQREIRDFKKPEMPAVLITNPPYGERLRPEDLSDIYRTLGEKLKREFQGGEAWIISSREELFDSMRLRPSFKVPLQNGSLDCELRKYVTFEGKLDNFRAQGHVVKTDDELRRMGEKGRFRDGRKRDFSRKRFDDDNEDEREDRRYNDRSAGDRKGKFGDRERRFDDRRSAGRRDNYDRDDRRYGDRDRRFDDRRDEANERYDRNIDFSDDPELAATYRNLRARHNTFERVRNAKDRKERGEKAEQRGDKRGFNDRRNGDNRYGRERKDRYNDRGGDRRRDDRRNQDRREGFNDRNRFDRRDSFHSRRDKGGFSRSRRDD